MTGRRRCLFCLLALVFAAACFGAEAAAESTTVVTGGFTTTDVGVFVASVAAKPPGGSCAAPASGDPSFGSFAVNAVGDDHGVAPSPIDLCVSYTDTQSTRGAMTILIRIDSFELRTQDIPTFEGADQAHFQIPNRYLVLTTVGAVTPTGVPPENGGTLTAETGDQTRTFDQGALAIATTGGESGSGTAVQELDLTLNIPAGVYPGQYRSLITIETVTGS